MVHDDPGGDPRVLAYARVSTSRQDHEAQLAALAKERPWRTYLETASGSETRRPERARLMAEARPGDTIVVWRLDRWGRSLIDLVETIEGLGRRGVGFRVLNGAPVDTTTPDGRLLLHLFSALAEFERALIAERTRAGQEAARAQGKHIGRPPAMDATKVEAALVLRHAGMELRAIARQLGVHERTLRRYLAQS